MTGTKPTAVKIIRDIEWAPGRVLRAGEIVAVSRADRPERAGQPFTVCVWQGEFEVIVRPQFFTTDLSADPAAVWGTRVASRVQKGYKDWIARPDRERSPEHDFGGWYSLNGEKDSGAHRWSVSWVEDTGEIYARSESTDEYIVLGKTNAGDEEHLERALEGWANPDVDVFHNLQALWEQIQARGASVRG